ncbi:hypothetical protein ACHAQJ_004764 [Trichoderma viride]
MPHVAEHTEETGLYHTPTATQIIVSMTLMKVKGMTTKDDGGLHASLRKYQMYDFAVSAIHYWDRYPKQILRGAQSIPYLAAIKAHGGVKAQSMENWSAPVGYLSLVSQADDSEVRLEESERPKSDLYWQLEGCGFNTTNILVWTHNFGMFSTLATELKDDASRLLSTEEIRGFQHTK